MQVVYALDTLPKSIFLAGPTPRTVHVPTWRFNAISLLAGLGFDGHVFVPERPDWMPHNDYDHQVEWEWEALNRASVVAFWIPRSEDMPAFTTNVEFGMSIASKKCLLGWPEGATKMKYLAKLAERYDVPTFHDLESLLKAAVARA